MLFTSSDENLQALLESDLITILLGKFWGDFLGRNTFSKIVALIVYEGRIRIEVNNVLFVFELGRSEVGIENGQ